ncbi:capsid cement protein [Catenuloplanes indicus]|uniref:DUF2190 family protein n=1 Tax=Catenuloplanes indicus TaxID=137267 RepID=A0AAE4B2E6_9ACTN|nr:capsid cement protein [Catenuloplanes indicus]MDQ0371601.1 hypothetical protein [Catenuloplanes indicus]MDQ0371614.1 hypothetical protein [Catenuloplanes indicus]
MGAYEPKFLYRDVITATASSTITVTNGVGVVLAVSGSGTVAPAGADSNAVVGTAAHDVVSGERFAYHPRGKVHISTAAGAITAGDRINAAAAGAVKTATAGVGNFGIALTTAADTALVEWMEI